MEKKPNRHTFDELKFLQALPLEIKVDKTRQRIREWYNGTGGDCAVSFSGGKDSTVLLHIAREMYPDIPAVYVDTGLEYPEIRRFVRVFDNVLWLRPDMSFRDVICKYGYPFIGKEVAHGLYYAKKTGTKSADHYMKRFNGTFMDKDGKKSAFCCEKYEPLLHVDFRIADQCCTVMKKKPLHGIKNNITAQMADESRLRKSKWLQHGCNAFDSTNPISNPMSFWTEQDVLQYIIQNGLRIAEPYGEIVPVDDQPMLDGCSGCKLKTSGCRRTGCVFCGFGAHLEKGEGRFQRLKRTHPKHWEYCMMGGAYDENGIWKPDKNGLGMLHVIQELNKIYGEHFIDFE